MYFDASLLCYGQVRIKVHFTKPQLVANWKRNTKFFHYTSSRERNRPRKTEKVESVLKVDKLDSIPQETAILEMYVLCHRGSSAEWQIPGTALLWWVMRQPQSRRRTQLELLFQTKFTWSSQSSLCRNICTADKQMYRCSNPRQRTRKGHRNTRYKHNSPIQSVFPTHSRKWVTGRPHCPWQTHLQQWLY